MLVPQFLSSTARPAAPWAARRAGDDYGVSAEPNWREVDWQRHLHQLQIGGRSVNFVDIGEGPGAPVVFVHGLGGCWQNWLENVPRATQERRTVALDLPGFGFSDMPAEQISISGFGRCVEELCDRLDLGPVALVGNSMGGFVSAEVAINFPERVDRLVLASAAGISSTNVYRRPALTAGRIAAVLTINTAARHRQVAARRYARHIALALVARHPSRLRPDLVYEGMMRGAGGAGFMGAMEACLDYDFRDRLPQIGCPTLVIWGEDDTILPVKDAEEFERLIPDARKLVMRDTGHVPMLERPETFNGALLEFLAERGEAEEREDAAA